MAQKTCTHSKIVHPAVEMCTPGAGCTLNFGHYKTILLFFCQHFYKLYNRKNTLCNMSYLRNAIYVLSFIIILISRVYRKTRGLP